MTRTSSFRTLLLAFAASAAALLTFATFAVAAEDDDSWDKATPVVGGFPYDAAFETDNDEDWYRLSVARRTQLDLRGRVRSCGPDEYSWCGGSIELVNRQGEPIADYVGFGEVDGEEGMVTGSLRWTVGPGTYYAKLSGGPRVAYRFQAFPADIGRRRPPVRLTLARTGSRYPRPYEAVTFGGSITPRKPVVSIVVYLKGSDGVYRKRGTLKANGSSGRYSRSYKPSRRGLYRVRARFSGDGTHATTWSPRSVYMRVR